MDDAEFESTVDIDRRLVIGGRYELDRLIGRGSMGAVYRARHTLTNNQVALKCIRADSADRELIIARFRREVAVNAAVEHEGIVKVFDAGELDAGMLYLAMELLDGETLHERSYQKNSTTGQGIDVVRSMLEPLAAVHAAGIVHRDIKPENIFIHRLPDGREQVKLLDFGIARDPRHPSTTRHDVGLGTPFYMSPEQATNARAVTATSDVWSVGVILYWLLAGQLPFAADTPFNTLTLVCTAEPAKITIANADETVRGLLKLIDDLLQKATERRPPNAGAVLQRMDAILGPRTAVQSAEQGVALPPSPLALAISPTLEIGRTTGPQAKPPAPTRWFRYAIIAVAFGAAAAFAYIGFRPRMRTPGISTDPAATKAALAEPQAAEPSPTASDVARPAEPSSTSAAQGHAKPAANGVRAEPAVDGVRAKPTTEASDDDADKDVKSRSAPRPPRRRARRPKRAVESTRSTPSRDESPSKAAAMAPAEASNPVVPTEARPDHSETDARQERSSTETRREGDFATSKKNASTDVSSSPKTQRPAPAVPPPHGEPSVESPSPGNEKPPGKKQPTKRRAPAKTKPTKKPADKRNPKKKEQRFLTF